MAISKLPKINDTFDTLDEVEEQLIAAVFPETGFSIKRNHRRHAHTAYFYCQSGRGKRDSGKVTRCEFRIKLVRKDEEWMIGEVDDEHNHGKSEQLKANPSYLPQRGSTLARVIKDVRAKGATGSSSSSSSRSTPKSSSHSSRKRRIPTTPDSSDDEGDAKRQCQSSHERNLGNGSPRPKVGIEHDKKPLILSDSDDEDVKPDTSSGSLENFLDSLSPTFKLSLHASLFRNPKIGITTREQLIEIGQSNLSGLMGKVGDKLGFAPANAFKKGMEKVLKKQK